jgi:hypothetical protein
MVLVVARFSRSHPEVYLQVHMIYLHILNRTSETLELPSITAKVVRSKALTGGKVAITQGGDRISISLPKSVPKLADMIIELELDRLVRGIESVKVLMP